jgi:excisionase family DNA binding protein
MIAEPDRNPDDLPMNPPEVQGLAGNLDELLTVQQVARFLQVSPRTVKRLVARGQFVPPLKIGRAVRWQRSHVQQWLVNCSHQSPPPTTPPPQDPLS